MRFLDIFTSGPNLTIYGNTRAKNDIGGIFSICVLAGLLYLGLTSVITLFNRKRLSVTTNLGSINNEDIASITKNNTMISFRIENIDQINIKDEDRLVSYRISKTKYTTKVDENGIYKDYSLPINLTYDFCHNINFSEPENNYTSTKNGYKCIKDLNGDFISNSESDIYININVKLCDNNTDLNITSQLPKTNCYSREEQVEKIKNDFYIVTLNQIDNKLDIKNFSNPFKYNLETLYWFIDSSLYIRSELYYQHIKVETDIGYFYENIHTKIGRKFEAEKNYLRNRKPTGKNLFDIALYFKSESTIVERTYYKVLTMIAELGSFFSICFNACSLGLLPVKDKLISCEIMSELYDFHIDESHEKKKFSRFIIDHFFFKKQSDPIKPKLSPTNITKNTLGKTKEDYKEEFSIKDNYHNIENMTNPRTKTSSAKLKKNNTENILDLSAKEKIQNQFTNNESSPPDSNHTINKSTPKIYEKDFSENKEIIKKSNEKSVKLQINEIIEMKKDDENNSLEIDSIVQKINTLSRSINSKKTDLSRIKYTSYQLFFSVFFCKFCKPNRVLTIDKFYNKCHNEMKEYLDINVIVRKLQEIESLKLLTCNQDQLSCFNFFVKPEIDENNCYRYSSKINSHYKNTSDQDKLTQIISYFIDKRDGKASELDSKILEMLDEEIVELIDTKLELYKKRSNNI